MKKLIVNADDFGRTRGISRGIMHAHLQGVVTSTTALMNMPDTEQALSEVRDICPSLGIGVHLNITQGEPLLPQSRVASLVDNSGLFHLFHKEPELVNTINLSELRAEWQAQIEKFLAFGLQPDHFDSHQHISYFHEEVMRIMLELARDYGVAVRFPADGYPNLIGRESAQILLQEFGVQAPQTCLTDFFGDEISIEMMAGIISTLTEGTHELMCHPGYSDAQLDKTSVYSRQRDLELNILTDAAVKHVLRENQVKLVSFADL